MATSGIEGNRSVNSKKAFFVWLPSRTSEAGLGMMVQERAPAFSAKASVQEPSPSLPRTIFVEHPRGDLDYGFIPKDIAIKWNGKGAPLRLLNGDENDGALHIVKNHGEQIRGIGFQNIQQFIAHVVEHADAIFQGKGKAIILAVRSDKPWSAATLKMEYDPHGDFYAVKTAMPSRETYFKWDNGDLKKAILWEGAPSLHRREAIPGALSGQSRLSIQNITPTDSPGKPGDDGSRHSIAGQSGDYQRDRIEVDTDAAVKSMAEGMKRDIGTLARWSATPDYTFQKHPVAWKIYNIFRDRVNRAHEILHTALDLPDGFTVMDRWKALPDTPFRFSWICSE